ncbi:MAG: Tfp pilus assembly protein ATPase PilM-like protein [Deltaproteobacteria bacterium]|nr:Tfp pilus assembly protein ATPase PilM-like protein [Deltaproteobacteria bacterium]
MFGFSKTVYGVDVGTKFLRAVRIKKGDTLSLEGYAERPLPEGVLLPSYTRENILDMKRFQDIAALTVGAAGVQRGDISLSIPDQVVKVSIVELKDRAAKRSDILKFIRWKSKRFLPYDPENAKIDYHLFGNAAMTVFVKGDVVSNYEEAFCSLSFNPRLVSTPSINLFNLFSQRFGDLKDFTFISVLEDSFAVVIVRNFVPAFYRSTEVGYADERLIQEINSSILFYISENPDAVLKKAFLFAGTGDRELLDTHLSDATGMSIVPLLISDMVTGPRGMDIETYGPAIAGALGSR